MILAMAECTEGPAAYPDQGFEENPAVADVDNLLDAFCWWMMKCEYL